MAEDHYSYGSQMSLVILQPIRLVLSTDLAGFSRNATVIASVVRRTARQVIVRCYTRGFRPASFEVKNLRVDFVEAGQEIAGRYPRHVVPSAFDRLGIIRDEPVWDRCLVMDHDMVCLSDLGEYFDEDFEGNLQMGVLFPPEQSFGWHMSRRGGLPESHLHAADFPYFRMGPMMNLALMREEDIWEKLLEAHEALKQEEQLALAAATGGRTKAVNPKWNQVPQWDFKHEDGSWRPPTGKEKGIIHWSGWGKPWHLNSKVWRPDLWEAERTSWEVLRAGEWDKPLMWDLSGAPASEIHQWVKRGWRMEAVRTLSEPPPLPEGQKLDEQKIELRAAAWKSNEEKRWDELIACPDVSEIAVDLLPDDRSPEVVFYRDVEQMKSVAIDPNHVILRGGVNADTGVKLEAMGYPWQWCRAKERQPGAVAEGVDYLNGPWQGEISDQAEMLAWNGKSEPGAFKS